MLGFSAATLHARSSLQRCLLLFCHDETTSGTLQAPAAPAEGQRAGLATRPRSHAALSGVESSGLVTLTESADDAAGADDAEMEEEVVGGSPDPCDESSCKFRCTAVERACLSINHTTTVGSMKTFRVGAALCVGSQRTPNFPSS